MKTAVNFAFAAVVGLFVALACQPQTDSTQTVGSDGAVDVAAAGEKDAAMIHGQRVTLSELDEYIKEAIFEDVASDPARLFDVRSKHLESMIDQRVVEEAAAADELSPEDFLIREVDALGEIPDDEIAAYYETHQDRMGDLSLEEISPRIRAFLAKQRADGVVASLREKAGAVVLLEPARMEVDAAGPSKGPDDATVTIVEFSDFQCPYCKRVVPTMEQVLEKYPTQVRVVFRHLPLDRIHARARPAAEASLCADAQGKFWEYHDLIFENNKTLADEDLESYASQLGLDMVAFSQCVADREFEDAVDEDTEAASELGLSGTPAFFVNGIRLTGARPLSEFEELIDAELARQSSEPAPPAG